MLAEYGRHRQLDALLALQRFAEHGRLMDLQPHVEADDDECGAGEERDAPAESKELIVGEPRREREEDAGRADEADRRAELREHSVPRAATRRRVLDREQHGAPPFAAQPESLAEAAEREQQWRGDTDRGVRRQQADQHRRDPHRQQGRDERGLAADAVAEVPEKRRPDRAGEERDGKRGQRRQRRRGRVRGGEEEPGKDQHRGRRVDVEVEELDRRPDQAGEEHLSRRIGSRRRGGCGRRHRAL